MAFLPAARHPGPSLWAMAVAVAVVLAHVPAFFHRLLDGDEAIYGSIAALMNLGGRLYAEGGVDNKPPGIFWVYAATFRVAGTYQMTAVHVVGLIVMLATCWLLFCIGRSLYGVRAGLLAALIYGVFTAAGNPRLLAANTEIFMMLPLAVIRGIPGGGRSLPPGGRDQPATGASCDCPNGAAGQAVTRMWLICGRFGRRSWRRRGAARGHRLARGFLGLDHPIAIWVRIVELDAVPGVDARPRQRRSVRPHGGGDLGGGRRVRVAVEAHAARYAARRGVAGRLDTGLARRGPPVMALLHPGDGAPRPPGGICHRQRLGRLEPAMGGGGGDRRHCFAHGRLGRVRPGRRPPDL